MSEEKAAGGKGRLGPGPRAHAQRPDVTKAAAVHIGADVLDSPEHATWPKPRFPQVTVDRLIGLCRSAGIVSQRRIVGTGATVDRVHESIADVAVAVGPGGLLVLSFSGHSQRAVPG